MKKIILSLTLIIMALCTTTSVKAQEPGRWKMGGKANIYAGWNGAIGIGGYGRYAMMNGFRFEPSITILCDEEAAFDISADLQYPFRLSHDIELYPLVGLSLNDPGRFGVGINLGGGLGYYISRKVSIDFGIKYMATTQRYIKDPVVYSFGFGFKL